MKLRTITGTRWPATCADGCGTRIPPGPEVKVVVDFDSRPRKTWIPEHSPDAGTWRKDPPKEEAKISPPPQDGLPDASSKAASSLGRGTPSFQPASTLRAPPEPLPKAPEPPKAPSPAPLALLGSAGASDATPNPAAGVPWATASLTFNAGAYESAKSGFADYSRPGESETQLRERVNRVVLEDVERQVRAMRELHERLGDVPQRKPTGVPA